MTQLADPPVPVDETTSPRPAFRHSQVDEDEGFEYRPMPMSAVVGGVLAVLAASALFAWMAIGVALLGALASLIALVRIWRSGGEFSGKWLAGGGLVLSVVFAVAGTFLTVHRYKTEMPPGYERVSFARDISARGIGFERVQNGAAMVIPPEVRALDGKQVYLKGYIYPTQRMYDLTQFVLCKDSDKCCFGGQPALQDMIGVALKGKQTTNYNRSLTGVAGTFRINKQYTGQGGDLEPLYLLEAEYVAPALTSL